MLNKLKGEGGWWMMSALAGPIGVAFLIAAGLLIVVAVML